jgi:cytoskeletal protein RodZ
VAPNGPPDDFHNQQTQYANYGGLGAPPPSGEQPTEAAPDQPDSPEALDPFDQEHEPTPWYRKPVGIIAWIVAVLILIALIVYGLMELIQGGSGTSHTPSTTSSTTPTTSTTTPPTPTTTQSSETPTSSAVEPPAQQPTQQPTHQPTQQQPTHRHHLPQLPSVITIPDGPVVTLPPGLS